MFFDNLRVISGENLVLIIKFVTKQQNNGL